VLLAVLILVAAAGRQDVRTLDPPVDEDGADAVIPGPPAPACRGPPAAPCVSSARTARCACRSRIKLSSPGLCPVPRLPAVSQSASAPRRSGHVHQIHHCREVPL